VPYTNVISGADAGALIPAEAAQQIVTATAQQSAAMALCRTVRMSSKTLTQPVLSASPIAYWVTSGLKQTSEAAWAGATLTPRRFAVVVPVEDAVLDDSGFPIWQELAGPLGQAFAQVLDAAVFAGTNKPASWPEAIIPGATAAGNVEVSAATPETGGVYGDLEQTLALVEADGFDGTGWAASRRLRPAIRQARSAQGNLLGEGSTSTAWDLPIEYAVSGSIPPPTLAIGGDWTMAVLGVRQDFRMEVFTEGVISDDTGKVIRNLMQEDTSAVRCTARYGFAVATPVTVPDAGAGTPYPFAVLNAAA
jgi:HK97 family phage major capsid protein